MVWAAASPIMIVYLIAFGATLNGTSSVFYAAVARLVDPRQGSRGYGIFYTGAFAGSAFAPVACGVLADRSGLGAVFSGLALLTLTIPLLALRLRGTAKELSL
jgi:dipeptide/tripeptide permease